LNVDFKGYKMSRFILPVVFLFCSSYLSAENLQKLVWPSPPDEPRIEYVTSATNPEEFGVEKGFFSKVYDFIIGENDTILSSPFGIHANKTRVYVTDIGSKSLYIFDKKNGDTINIRGSDKETFLYPIDVISDSKGNVYVSDSIRAKIYVFDKDGDFSYSIKKQIFQRPVGIAIGPDNKKLYIVDAVASQVHVTTLKGKFLYSIGKNGSADGEFNRPTFIDVAKDGNIYVSDSMNHRVQILDENGKYIYKFGKLGQNIGSFGSPRGIALDKDDNIYISDTMFNTIQIFNKEGELLMVFGHYGGRKGEFALAEDISILQDGTIYITDTNNKRVQVFKLLDFAQRGSLK